MKQTFGAGLFKDKLFCGWFEGLVDVCFASTPAESTR